MSKATSTGNIMDNSDVGRTLTQCLYECMPTVWNAVLLINQDFVRCTICCARNSWYVIYHELTYQECNGCIDNSWHVLITNSNSWNQKLNFDIRNWILDNRNCVRGMWHELRAQQIVHLTKSRLNSKTAFHTTVVSFKRGNSERAILMYILFTILYTVVYCFYK